MSTLDDFQKRISKLESNMAEIKKVIEEIKRSAPKPTLPPTLPEASDFMEERIAEEAVEEVGVIKPKEESSEEQ